MDAHIHWTCLVLLQIGSILALFISYITFDLIILLYNVYHLLVKFFYSVFSWFLLLLYIVVVFCACVYVCLCMGFCLISNKD